MKNRSNIIVRALTFIVGLLFAPVVLATETPPGDFVDPTIDCGNLNIGTDYRRNDEATNKLKKLVEGAHFTKGVQRGEYGNAASLEGDLDYVLNKFPNHPKALLVAAKNQMKPGYTGQYELRKDRYYPTKECYFKKALTKAPDDPSVHLVIAIFYHQYGNYNVANRHYRSAVKLAPKNPEVHYNYGLLLFKIGQQEKAAQHAKIAYEMGYPLPGLKNKLIAANKWQASPK